MSINKTEVMDRKRKTLQDYLLKNISELFLNLEDFLKIIVMTSFHMKNVSLKKKKKKTHQSPKISTFCVKLIDSIYFLVRSFSSRQLI